MGHRADPVHQPRTQAKPLEPHHHHWKRPMPRVEQSVARHQWPRPQHRGHLWCCDSELSEHPCTPCLGSAPRSV